MRTAWVVDRPSPPPAVAISREPPAQPTFAAGTALSPWAEPSPLPQVASRRWRCSIARKGRSPSTARPRSRSARRTLSTKAGADFVVSQRDPRKLDSLAGPNQTETPLCRPPRLRGRCRSPRAALRLRRGDRLRRAVHPLWRAGAEGCDRKREPGSLDTTGEAALPRGWPSTATAPRPRQPESR